MDKKRYRDLGWDRRDGNADLPGEISDEPSLNVAAGTDPADLKIKWPILRQLEPELIDGREIVDAEMPDGLDGLTASDLYTYQDREREAERKLKREGKPLPWVEQRKRIDKPKGFNNPLNNRAFRKAVKQWYDLGEEPVNKITKTFVAAEMGYERAAFTGLLKNEGVNFELNVLWVWETLDRRERRRGAR
jgi:hypothetical protein